MASPLCTLCALEPPYVISVTAYHTLLDRLCLFKGGEVALKIAGTKSKFRCLCVITTVLIGQDANRSCHVSLPTNLLYPTPKSVLNFEESRL